MGVKLPRGEPGSEERKAYHSAHNKVWYAANKIEHNARSRAWRIKNLERSKALGKAHREANKEWRSLQAKAYRTENKERVNAAIKAWATANKERVKAKAKIWEIENPDKRRANCARRRARKRKATPGNADHKIIAIFYAAAERVGKCIGVRFHVDHIQSLAHGGLHHQSNLQLLPAVINLRKSAQENYTLPWEADAAG